MDFICIDFETATPERHSPCEIGLSFVKNNKIIGTKSWLIKPYSYPYFHPFNIMIHGIYPDEVADKPEFPEIWQVVKPLIENKLIIAHNAGFDISVLRNTLEYYSLEFPNLQYVCSYIFSKKVWTGLPSYDLETLCHLNKISLKHHRAGADSKACAELSLKAIELKGIESLEEFPEKLKTTIGQLYSGGFKPSHTKREYEYRDLSKIIGNPEKHNTESIFYGKHVVFTGTLSSMIRLEAQKIIADIGGINCNSVNKHTDFLVVGFQDYRVVGEDGMSTKQEKTIRLIEKGYQIEILSEADFLKNI